MVCFAEFPKDLRRFRGEVISTNYAKWNEKEHKMKAFLTSAVLIFTAVAVQAITANNAHAWSTTVHLQCNHAPWGNCPSQCNDYKDCLTTPPAGGCGTQRTALCDCLQDLDPNYNCTKIPTTVASIAIDQMLDLDHALASTANGNMSISAEAVADELNAANNVVAK